MRTVLTILLAAITFGCSSKPKYNTTVTGFVKGLQKGTLYLQSVKDTAYVTLDSINIDKEQNFELGCNLEEPEVLYLSLSKINEAERISFFSSSKPTVINTTLKQFISDARIEGGVQQSVLAEYNTNIIRFKDKELELLETSLNAQRLGNDSLFIITEEQRQMNVRRKYLYSINFAVNNSNSEVAPYVALADIYDAKLNFLDTIYNSLSPTIAKSKYGIMLNDYIQDIRSEE